MVLIMRGILLLYICNKLGVLMFKGVKKKNNIYRYGW